MKQNNISFRHELKYIINYHEYRYLIKRFTGVLEQDKHSAAGQGGYHVRSLYFDDIYNSALNEKRAGIANRKKYRVRIYNKSDTVIHFEKKLKHDQYISKIKENLTKDEYYKLLNHDYQFLLNSDSQLYRELYLEFKNNLLKPVVIVDYDREVYTVEAGNVRITFDKNLQAGFNTFDIFAKRIATKTIFEIPVMILEIKYESFLPVYVQNLLQICSHSNTSASKYVMCVEAVNKLK